MNRRLSHKLATTLGAAGLGLGIAVSSLGGASLALAQESTPPAPQVQAADASEETRLRYYEAFSAALATELSAGGADEIDTAIRAALVTVFDGWQSDGLLTAGQVTAVTALIESADVPVSPGPMLGARGGMMGHGGPGGNGPGMPATDDRASAADDGQQGGFAIGQTYYADFTAALAAELGASTADEVDGAIRLAMIAAIDTVAAENEVPAGAVDALKTLVATSDAPLGPALGFGPGRGGLMGGMPGGGHGGMFPGGGPGGMFPGGDKGGWEQSGSRGGDDRAEVERTDDAQTEVEDSSS